MQDCHAVCENKDGCTDFTWHSPAAEVFTSTLTFDQLFHFLFLFQVFPNSCFLFSSCINKEYSYGCFSGGRHCRRVVASLLERFFHSQFLSNVGTLQFNFHQNQCHRCSQDHACDAHWTAFVGFGDNIRYQSTSSVTVRHIHCQSPNLASIFC